MPGFGQSPASRYGMLLFSQSGPAAVTPSESWTGVEGSGFTSVPNDPPRLTAKPAAQWLEPIGQFFTDELTTGVAAFANMNATLIGGIDRVRFHFEGTRIDAVQPSYRQFRRYDGSDYSVLGYWVALKRPPTLEGDARLYAEVIPSDAVMQSRVLGPAVFYARSVMHDQELTVDHSRATSSKNFHTLGAALGRIKAAGSTSQNSLIQ